MESFHLHPVKQRLVAHEIVRIPDKPVGGVAVAAAGFVGAAAAFSFPGDLNVQVQAVATLRGLSATRVSLFDDGAICFIWWCW